MASDTLSGAGGFSAGFDHLPYESLWIPSISTSLYGATRHIVDYDNVGGDAGVEGGGPYFHPLVKEELCDDEFEMGSSPRCKKRRLTASQVQFLERSFETENKLEPERKIQLAKEIGLQPRQVAIWFQNRRARFKNKQLEKDFDSLKSNFDRLKSDYSSLLHEKETLKNQVSSLKEKLTAREKASGPFLIPAIVPPPPPAVVAAQEAAKSDLINSDSPHSVLIESSSQSHVFEENQSDYFSQDEDDHHNNSLMMMNRYNSRFMIAAAAAARSSSSAANNCFEKFGGSKEHPLPEFPVEDDQPYLVLDLMNWM